MSDSYLQTYKVRDLITEHVSGPSPTCEERNIQSEDEWGLLKTTAVVWDGWNPEAHKVPPKEYWYKYNLEIKNGDILVTKAGPRNRVGVVVYVDKTPPRLMVSGKMIGLKPNHKIVDYRALAAALSSESSQRYLDIRTTGMAEAQLNFTNQLLLGTEVHLPALKAQKKISSILSTVDSLIEKTQDLIDKYTAIKQGMMADLFTCGIDLSGTPESNKNYGQLRPTVTEAPELYKETELGWVPKGWEVQPIRERIEITYGKSQVGVRDCNGTIPVYGTGGIIEYANSSMCNENSILIGRKGTLNRPYFVNPPFWVVDTAYYVSNFIDGDMKFLSHLLSQFNFMKLNESTGVPSLNRETIYREKLPFPSSGEQVQIKKRLESIDALISDYKIEKEKYSKQKKGLMQDLLTGKVKV